MFYRVQRRTILYHDISRVCSIVYNESKTFFKYIKSNIEDMSVFPLTPSYQLHYSEEHPMGSTVMGFRRETAMHHSWVGPVTGLSTWRRGEPHIQYLPHTYITPSIAVLRLISISLRLTSLIQGQYDDYPSASEQTLTARFMGTTWGPPGADRTQVGPMLAPWTLISGRLSIAFVVGDGMIW